MTRDQAAEPAVSAITAGAPTSVLARGLRGTTLGLPLVVTLFAFDNLGVTTVMPRVARDLHGLGLYGWTFSAFTLASIIGLVVAGPHADRHGPAPSLAAGLAVFVAGLVVTATAPTMAVLVAGRGIQGLGSGAFGTTMYVVVGRAYPSRLRPRMFAVLSTAWVVPSLVGPALSGWVADTFGWRPVFGGLAVLAAVPILLTVPRLRSLSPPRSADAGPGAVAHESEPDGDAGASPGATSLPVLRALSVAAGGALFVAGLTSSSWPSAAGLVVAGLAVGVPGLRRVLPPGTVRARRGTPAGVALRGTLNLAFFGTDAFIPLLLVRLHHVSAARAGLPLTAAALSWTAGSWLAERAARRWGPPKAAAAGLVVCAGGIGGVLAAIPAGRALVVAGAAWCVAGLGMGIVYNLVSVSVVDAAPSAQMGTVSSALSLTDSLGIALGTGVGGALVALAGRTGWDLSSALRVQFLLNAGMAVASMLLAARLAPARAETDVRLA